MIGFESKGVGLMLNAYDTILQTEVDARHAVQDCGHEQYRYVCTYCGEEAFVAALFSKKQSVHFRHRNGDNDKDCPFYLGGFSDSSIDSQSNQLKKNAYERVDFYFDCANKVFNIGLRLSVSEIQEYENHKVSFELRANSSSVPFATIRVSATNFKPDELTLIPIDVFSFDYHLSNTHNKQNRKYNVFKRKTPTVFKVLGNEDVFNARMVQSKTLFTNTKYFVLFQSGQPIQRSHEGVDISDPLQVDTMGNSFTGIIIKIQNNTSKVKNLVSSWGYELEESDTLTLLWPPARSSDDIANVRDDSAFLYTSFALQSQSNISVKPFDIQQICKNVTNISFNTGFRVFRRNAEIQIRCEKCQDSIYNENKYHADVIKCFTVLDDFSYFYFGADGVLPLRVGQIVNMTQQSMIKGFDSSYLCKTILPLQHTELVGQDLLADILAHSKKVEPLVAEDFNSLPLTDLAMEYIFECEAAGRINAVVKQYILEGRL